LVQEIDATGAVDACGDRWVPPIASEDKWQVATPESVGIDGSKLSPLVARFEEWKEANLHGVIVVRRGKLAFEHYFRGFDLKARGGPGSSISMRRPPMIYAQ
jgi:hypothetical protein